MNNKYSENVFVIKSKLKERINNKNIKKQFSLNGRIQKNLKDSG